MRDHVTNHPHSKSFQKVSKKHFSNTKQKHILNYPTLNIWRSYHVNSGKKKIRYNNNVYRGCVVSFHLLMQYKITGNVFSVSRLVCACLIYTFIGEKQQRTNDTKIIKKKCTTTTTRENIIREVT